MRLAYLILSGLFWSTVTFAEQHVLSTENVQIGRFRVADLDSILQLTVDPEEDVVIATHVIARFQNNRPQQRMKNGDWVLWGETTSTLLDTGLSPNSDGSITFELVKQDLSQHFLPIIFTVAYQTEKGFKSGYIVVDP